MENWNYLLSKGLKKFVTVLDYPKVLGTIYNGLNREHIKDLLFIKMKLGFIPQTIVDVGAAIGEYSKAARYVFPEASIYAFEPIPSSFHILKKMSKSDKKLTVFNCALSDENKYVSFYLNEFSFSSSLLKMTNKHKQLFPQTNQESIIEVKEERMDSIKEVVVKKPAVLKIDVQGTELKVLNGSGILLSSFDIVQLEVNFESLYEEQARYPEIFSLMFHQGFQSFIQTDIEFANKANKFPTFCDVIFLR